MHGRNDSGILVSSKTDADTVIDCRKEYHLKTIYYLALKASIGRKEGYIYIFILGQDDLVVMVFDLLCSNHNRHSIPVASLTQMG